MGNILRGIFYTGLAATVGVVGYIAGKSKHWKGISLTTMGLALILYTPRGCDTLEKYATIRGEIAKAKIYGAVKQDSLDAVLNREKERDSSRNYVWNAMQEISLLEQNLKDSYGKLLRNTEDKFQNVITGNNSTYKNTLRAMQEQNDALQENLNALVEMQKEANSMKANVESGGYKKSENGTDYNSSYPRSNVLVAGNDTANVTPAVPRTAVRYVGNNRNGTTAGTTASSVKSSSSRRHKSKSPESIKAVFASEWFEKQRY